MGKKRIIERVFRAHIIELFSIHAVYIYAARFQITNNNNDILRSNCGD